MAYALSIIAFGILLFFLSFVEVVNIKKLPESRRNVLQPAFALFAFSTGIGFIIIGLDKFLALL